MIGALNLTEDKTVNVLTEVTESRDGEKDNSSISAPSTHRSRA
jgi:serine/threonine protein kinase